MFVVPFPPAARRRPLARAAVSFAAALLTVGATGHESYAAPPPFLPPPAPRVEAAFAALGPLAGADDGEAWAAALRDARDLAAHDWVPVAPGRWAGPDRAVAHHFLSAPPAARAAWARLAAARAARLREEIEEDPSDPRPPFTLARELPFTPAGRGAAAALAAAAFREGRLEEARARWADLAAAAGDGPLSAGAAEWWAKVILADLAAGRFGLAEWERGRFLSAFPEFDAAGAPPDLTGPFDRTRWPPRALPAATRTARHSACRDGRLRALPRPFASGQARDVAAGGPSWAVPRADVGPAGDDADAALPSAPAIWGETVLYSTGRRVVGLGIKTGRPRWPVDEEDDGTLFPPPTDPLSAGPPPFPLSFDAPDREPPPTGSARAGLTVHGNLLIARLGDPAVEWPPRALRVPTSALVCLDLQREGELRWEVDAAALAGDAGEEEDGGARWSWEGAPAAGADPLTGAPRAFAVARRNRPRVRLDAVGLDLSTGTILWRTPLGAARSLPAPAARTVSSIAPTLCGGRVFIDTGAGAVACVDAADGRPLWLSAFDRDPAAAASSSVPPTVVAGTLFLAPADGRGVRALDAATGELLWARDLPGAGERVLGVAANRLLVAGWGLWGLDPATGETVWFKAPPHVVHGPADPHAAGLIGPDQGGKAVAAWVTADRVLFVGAADGAEVGAVPLAEAGVRAGTLAGSPGAAALLTPRALVGWTGAPAVRSYPLARGR